MVMGMTTGHIRILGRKPMHQAFLLQEFQGSIDGRGGTTPPLSPEVVQQFIGPDRASLTNDQFQNLPTQRRQVTTPFLAQGIGLSQLFIHKLLTGWFDS